jgi:RNA polymerase sigma-70 factor (ECF subfamily)
MERQEFLATEFEANRSRLSALAYRMLGSKNEAEDVVQEVWLRLSRSETDGVSNLGGWLTTVGARICLDMLRARKARREEPLEFDVAETTAIPADRHFDAEAQALLADSVGVALLVVLERLDPAERLALVLHDMFDVPFDEIATIVGRSPVATRQLASRARRRVQGEQQAANSDLARRRQVVDAFLAASRNGNFEALLAVLDPEVTLRADPEAVRLGSLAEIHGATAVAGAFNGRAQAARLTLINGMPGLTVAFGGELRIAIRFMVSEDGKIGSIEAIANPAVIGQLTLSPLGV